MILRIFKIAIR